MTSPRRGRVRRAGRYLLDAFAMGGTARAGVSVGAGRHLIQTRAIADAALFVTSFEEEQSERNRAIWSAVGAVLLGGFGVATLAYGWPSGNLLSIATGAAAIVVALLVMRAVLTRSTQGSTAHVAGVAVLAVAVLGSILSPPPLLGDWSLALPAIGVAVVAGVCLVVGRRG